MDQLRRSPVSGNIKTAIAKLRPNGVTLQIRSIWMKENVSGVTKFITLVPEK